MYRFDKSEKMFERLSKVLAGGVGSQVRSASKPVLFFTHGKGSKLYDVDGNEYIDYLLGYGPSILGYAHPVIVNAIKERVEKGMQFGSEGEDVIKLCEKLVEIIPCAEMVKLNSTGSESVNLDEIANDPEIKIVSIATPDFSHFEPAIKMIKAGKNVLIEKPIATTVKECEEILKESKKQNIKIMVNFHNRWYPPFKEAKKIVGEGLIGIPVSAFIRLSDLITVPTKMLSWSNKSGLHWFLFPHTIDLIKWIFNDEIIKVYACGRKGVLKNLGIDTYDVVIVQATFNNGSIATFESSWIIPESWRNNIIEMRAEIYGEKGRIGINADNEGIEVSAGNTYKTPLLYDFVTEEEPIKYFIDCVINDKVPSPIAEDGLKITKIIEAIT